MNSKPTAIELIAAERQRQISVEGWTPEHDDKHELDELAEAAIAYIITASPFQTTHESALQSWPWSRDCFKPSLDPIRNLVKAGALIVAEIERLQRKEAHE